MKKQIIKIKWLRYGQPKPYSDSYYEAVLTFEAEREEHAWIPEEVRVKIIANAVVHEFYEQPEWHQAKLVEIEKLESNRWRVLIVEPYLD